MSDRKIPSSSHESTTNFPRTREILDGRIAVLESGLADARTTPWQRAHLEELAWEAAMMKGMLSGSWSMQLPEDF